jgi:hypothetical protein
MAEQEGQPLEAQEPKPKRRIRDFSKYRECNWWLFETVPCNVCGAQIQIASKARHQRTIKHKQAEYLWFDRFEIK